MKDNNLPFREGQDKHCLELFKPMHEKVHSNIKAEMTRMFPAVVNPTGATEDVTFKDEKGKEAMNEDYLKLFLRGPNRHAAVDIPGKIGNHPYATDELCVIL